MGALRLCCYLLDAVPFVPCLGVLVKTLPQDIEPDVLLLNGVLAEVQLGHSRPI